jgi:transposase
LRRGPAAQGWDVDQRWTLARIVTVTERLFGVSYTLSGMSVLLRRNGWSVQVLREAGRRT